ncbi:primosomal protein DnaI [Kurthia massiliensis]|uniref:primosomal protein DnaI n=1 Tax=Kurthia massiliensis TaxID=1033739 RepID=UPI0002897C43|nr:primosomal protein DnaI [Kurthia massiliensis]
MEPINKQLQQMKGTDFNARLQQIQQEVLKHPAIQSFINEHQLSQQTIERGMGKLLEFTSQQHDCSACESVATCKNPINGLVPKLIVERDNIDLEYVPCDTKRREDDRRKTASMISSMHMPREVMKATLDDIKVDSEQRLNAYKEAMAFIVDVKKNREQLPSVGLYLHGSFGVGKSFVLAAIANELATMEIRTILVYVPEFLRELKSAIGENSLEEKIDFVKKAPVLMLDDLGAETLTTWTRDEILGTILHYRMAERLPTFISSNLNYAELEKHLAKTRGDVDPVKAGRIMERIRTMTKPVDMTGENRRSF